jgi:hypothetical protein
VAGSAACRADMGLLAVFPNGKRGLPRPVTIKWGLIFSFTTKLDYDCETKQNRQPTMHSAYEAAGHRCIYSH